MFLFCDKKIDVWFSEDKIADFVLKSFVFTSEQPVKVTIAAMDKPVIIFDINGQIFTEPEFVKSLKPIQIIGIESTFLILEMPSEFLQTIEIEHVNWLDILYFEVLDSFSRRDLTIDKLFISEAVKLIKDKLTIPEIEKKVVGERQKRRLYQSIGTNRTLLKRAERFVNSIKNFDDHLQEFDLSGYTDQSHFIKECKQFTGYTPAVLIRLFRNVRFLQYKNFDEI